VNDEVSAATPRPAGFWIRAVAFVLDLLVFALVAASLAALARRRWGPALDEPGALPVAVVLHTLLFSVLYVVVLHASTGQTVGKMLAGARVVGADGARVPLGTAFLRYVAYYASLLPFGFGFLMAGLRRDKRALHDLLAGTRVDRWPPRPRPAAAPPPPAAAT
jgi:uncharacterized RDD family membrane protein YckC